MKEYVVDGRYYFPSLKKATNFANYLFKSTGVIVSVEAV